MMMMMGRRSPTRENVTGRKCILRPPSRVISGLRIIVFFLQLELVLNEINLVNSENPKK